MDSGNTGWFVHDRFGLFVHWGIYAVAARHEWIQSREKMTAGKYLHIFSWPLGHIHLEGFAGRIVYAQFLHDGPKILFRDADPAAVA